MTTTQRDPRAKGMSLLEVVLSLSLLVLGLLPMAQLLVVSDHQRLDSELSYRMHLVAANQLEVILMEAGSVEGLQRRYPSGTQTLDLPTNELIGLPITEYAGHIQVEMVEDRTALLRVQVDYVDAAGRACRGEANTVVSESGS